MLSLYNHSIQLLKFQGVLTQNNVIILFEIVLKRNMDREVEFIFVDFWFISLKIATQFELNIY